MLNWSLMSIEEQIRSSVEAVVPASVEVLENGGHFSLKVTSSVFEGKKTLEKQRLVYSSLKELMAGNNTPIHAIDNLETRIPGN